jgi:hypothetical protein
VSHDTRKEQSLGWMHSLGDNHRVGELVLRRWLEQYRSIANDGDGGTGASEGSLEPVKDHLLLQHRECQPCLLLCLQ